MWLRQGPAGVEGCHHLGSIIHIVKGHLDIRLVLHLLRLLLVEALQVDDGGGSLKQALGHNGQLRSIYSEISQMCSDIYSTAICSPMASSANKVFAFL